jgi:hypothetical protein
MLNRPRFEKASALVLSLEHLRPAISAVAGNIGLVYTPAGSENERSPTG